MPITGSSSYIPTMNEFIAHWAQCNAALAPAVLLVERRANVELLAAEAFASFAPLRPNNGAGREWASSRRSCGLVKIRIDAFGRFALHWGA